MIRLFLAALLAVLCGPVATAQSLGPSNLTAQSPCVKGLQSTGRVWSDSFDCGPWFVADRPGWTLLTVHGGTGQTSSVVPTVNTRPTNYLVVSDGYSTQSLFGQDIGRMDGGFVQVTMTPNGRAYATFNYVDFTNYFQTFINATQISLSYWKNGVSNNLLFAATTNYVGSTLRVEWSWSGSTCTFLVYVNGQRYPNASTSYSVTSATLGFGPSPWVGEAYTNASADNYMAGILPTAPFARVTMAPVQKIYVLNTAGTGSQPTVSGTMIGTNAVEFRLVQNGSVVSGWDWGQKAWASFTTDGGNWAGQLPVVPIGAGYSLEVRATNDTSAGSKSRVFGVGYLGMLNGQSLALQGIAANIAGPRTAPTQANTYLAYPGLPASGATFLGAATLGPELASDAFDMRKAMLWAGDATTGNGTTTLVGNTASLMFAGIRASGNSAPLGWGNAASCGSSKLAWFKPTDTTQCTAGVNPLRSRFQMWKDVIYGMGGDLDFVDWSQGQEDAGRTPTTAAFDATAAAQYITDFNTTMDAIRTYLGRTPAQLPIVVTTLGKMRPNCLSSWSPALYNAIGSGACTTNTGNSCNPGSASSACPADQSWDLFRYTQWQITQQSGKNFLLGHSQLDLTMADTNYAQVHSSNADQGYPEDAYRFGLDNAYALGLSSNDGRGPKPGTPVRSGTTLAITFSMNGTDTLVCACGTTPPSNFFFYADSTFTTQIVPTSFAISGTTATWTFASTLPTGVVVTSGKTPPNRSYPGTGGIWPDVDNAVKGQRTADSMTVISDLIFVPLVSN